MKYKSEWHPNSLNKSFWNEVLKGRKIAKLTFNKTGLKYLVLDSGEKVFVDCFTNGTPLYIKTERKS